MKKRFLSTILILAIILSTFFPVLAAEKSSYIKEAEKLKTMGVFQGSDIGLELDREATRIEGMIMLIRLLGKESEAEALKGQASTFTDVPEWGLGYVNYAEENGLTKGISKNLFGSNKKIDAKSYVTFMLRALGYNDSKGDFLYNDSIKFAKDKGIIDSSDERELNTKVFLRDHLAKVSILALNANMKEKPLTLLENLVDEGVILKSVAEDMDKNSISDLEVHFIDVGQADAIFIKKGDQAMLIDGGNNSDGKMIVDYIKKKNISKLEYIIATHPHADHIGGLDDVVDNFEIGKIIMPDVISTTQTFEDFIDSIGKKNLSLTKPKLGAEYDLNGALITVIAPSEKVYSILNDYSVVVKVQYGNNSFLFTGDAEKTSETEMLEKNKAILSVDVLKLGHHGSMTSTTKDFLDAVDPQYAVISVGRENKYGHPDDEVLNRLISKNIHIYRTDLDGNIIAISDGNTIIFYKNNRKLQESSNTEEKPVELVRPNVIISSLDKIAEVVTVSNNSEEDVDLTGWTLLSVTGNQEFIFPEYILKANSRIVISSGVKDGDFYWGKQNVWNNSQSDPAVLFDGDKNEVYRFND